MKQIFILITALSLSGCNTPERQARNQAEDQAYCQSIGATGEGFAGCMMYRDQARRDERQRRSDAFNAANAALQKFVADESAKYKQTVTTCQPFGGSVRCTSN